MYTLKYAESDGVRWQALDAHSNASDLPNFMLPSAILTPEPALTMGRAVNSDIQSPQGDGKPKAGFLNPTNGRITASGPVGLYKILTDYASVLKTAVLLRLISDDGELEWDLWPAASFLSSARTSGQTSNSYFVDGYFGVKALLPRGALSLGRRVDTSGNTRIDALGHPRAVVQRIP